MDKNDKANKISLSSWSYGNFFSTNPVYYQRRSSVDNKNQVNNVCNNENIKIVKQDYFDNILFEEYVNRDLHLHNKFVNDIKEKRIESQRMIKKNGISFNNWKNKKNMENKLKILIQKLKEEKNINDEEEKQRKLLLLEKVKEQKQKKKKEELKRIELEKRKKAEKYEENKRRREQMLKWEKDKDELIKNKKAQEKKKDWDKKVKEEKNMKEKQIKNKEIFVKWLKNKIKEKRVNENKENKENSIKKNKDNEYEKIKHEEIIGPFHFGKELREAQKRFYKNQNKMNKNKFINRSNTAKK